MIEHPRDAEGFAEFGPTSRVQSQSRLDPPRPDGLEASQRSFDPGVPLAGADFEGGTAGLADPLGRNSVALGCRQEFFALPRADYDSTRALAEERAFGAARLVEGNPGPDELRSETGLGQCHGQAPVGHIVGGSQPAGLSRFPE